MQKPARLSSKNQVTIPAEVRRALGVKAGEAVVFDIDTGSSTPRVTVRSHPTLEELAGTVPVPPEVVGLTWNEIRARAWAPEPPISCAPPNAQGYPKS